MSSKLFLAFGILPVFCACLIAADSSDRVRLERTPDGGLQPQAAVDADGTLHLIYFKGEAKAGDLFYVHQARGQSNYSKPIQINSLANSAIAVGTIRGAQLAVGRGNRVHVAWNGNMAVLDARHAGAPLWYARMNDAGTGFESQRDLMHFSAHLDGGGSLAADGRGHVYVLWHAAPDEATRREASRAVYLARSSDDGRTFGREVAVNPTKTGACGCCGMKAFVDGAGSLFALYRTAGGMVNRDMTLMVSRDHGQTFEVIIDHQWKVASCPMSSAALTGNKARTVAAWETDSQVYFAVTPSKSMIAGRPLAPAGLGKRKHPAAALAANGDLVLAWTEGTGWQRGGSLAWQVFDANGNATALKGRVPGVPVWGTPAAAAMPDGKFLIFY